MNASGIAEYGLTFLEGMLAFVSPCILPMLPVYLLYLVGDKDSIADSERIVRRIKNTLGFVLGFTILFMMMGAGASAIGVLLQQHRKILQRIGGIILIVFGLQFLGIFNIGFLNKQKRMNVNMERATFLSSLLFGAAFSLGWTPCMGPFVGAALMQAGSQKTIFHGMALLFTFSMGLGLPFLLISILYEKIRPALGFFKKNMRTIQIISGIVLIIVGAMLALGFFDYYARLFNW